MAVKRKQEAKGWFFGNKNSTATDVSEEFDIPLETVRGWIKREGWVAQRSKYVKTPTDIKEQAAGIRLVLFRTIMEGEHSPSELKDLVASWNQIVNVEAPKEKEEQYDRDLFLADLQKSEPD